MLASNHYLSKRKHNWCAWGGGRGRVDQCLIGHNGKKKKNGVYSVHTSICNIVHVPGICNLSFLSSPYSPPFSNSGCVKRKINERLQYLGRQFLSEMGLTQWKSLDFWSMVIIFILCWWIRLYLHYVAQYGFLRISNIPVIRSVSVMYTIVGP